MKKEKYYDAVLHLSESKSLTSISVRDIANYLNISTGSLYYQFANKDDLLNSMFIKYKAQMLNILKPCTSITQLLKLYLEYNSENIAAFKFTYSSELAHFLTQDSKDFSFNVHLQLLEILNLKYQDDSHITTIIFGTMRAYLIAPDYMLRCDQDKLIIELVNIIKQYQNR